MLTLTTLRLGLVVASTLALMAGLYIVFDAIGDAREEKVRAELTAQREAEKDAERQAVATAAEAAAGARQGALLPGSVARLRAGWCRDCSETR